MLAYLGRGCGGRQHGRLAFGLCGAPAISPVFRLNPADWIGDQRSGTGSTVQGSFLRPQAVLLARSGKMKMRSPLRPLVAALICIAALGLAVQPSEAQTRKPTAGEITRIRACAAKYAENLDEGERQCLFNLVADPCMGKTGDAPKTVVVECYLVENSIWDALLNENYKSLIETLDDEQTAKARAMQRAWTAYRDTTCQFYDDKIQGSMSITMHAACVTRESARRAMLLKFFGQL
jgi:uncharacterized protein YecT (DUF1311 family)